ncbi:MAG: DUF1570 domain-containing protein [Planctomycetaceae bacterium]|nr:DUF1570 domain-containing protein [Planctomycetaceae bacterium]
MSLLHAVENTSFYYNRFLLITLFAAASCLVSGKLQADDHLLEQDKIPLWKLSYQDNFGEKLTFEGKKVAQTNEGVILLQKPDRTYVRVDGDNVVQLQETDKTFSYLSAEEFEKQVRENFTEDLGDFGGRRFERTEHYLIISGNYSTDQDKRFGIFIEQVYDQFYAHWKRFGVELEKPPLPLVIILDPTYEFTDNWLPDERVMPVASAGLKGNFDGLYLLSMNRAIVDSELSLDKNDAADVVKQAYIQLCYSSGLFQPYADIPDWVAKGSAWCFGAPDYQHSFGWSRPGSNHYLKLYPKLSQHTPTSLTELVSSDSRFQVTPWNQINTPDPLTTMGEEMQREAHAFYESSLLIAYLFKHKRSEVGKYMQRVSQLKPLQKYEEQQRRADFEAAFGDDWKRLDQQLKNYGHRLKR